MDFAKESYGNLAANADVFFLDVRGLNTVGIQVAGSMSATLQFEGTVDGTNWFALNTIPFSSAAVVTSATAAGTWFANVSALNAVRVRCSAYTSGTPSIFVRAVPNGMPTAAGASANSSSSLRGLKTQQQTTITTSTAETTVLTAVAATYLDVYGVIVVNSSATAVDVTFKDDTTGTTRFNIYVPAGETRGFMLPSADAHNQAVLNKPWTATCSASVTSIKITMLAIKNV